MVTDGLVGVVGLGQMGEAIASRLLERGRDVCVYDVRPEPVERLSRGGARSAQSLAELAELCNQVHVLVVDDAQVERVVGEQGLLGGDCEGMIVVIHSTVLPSTVQHLDAIASSRGAHVVDAPISGWVSAAEAGTLTLMIGGDSAAVERCWSTFELIGSLLVHVGPTGHGATAKLVNNLGAVVALTSTSEALRISRAFGIADQTVLDIMQASTGDSWVVRNWTAVQRSVPSYTTGTAGFEAMMRKDLSLAVRLAHEVGVEVPVAAAAVDAVAHVVDKPEPNPEGAR